MKYRIKAYLTDPVFEIEADSTKEAEDKFRETVAEYFMNNEGYKIINILYTVKTNERFK